MFISIKKLISLLVTLCFFLGVATGFMLATLRHWKKDRARRVSQKEDGIWDDVWDENDWHPSQR